MNKRRRRKLSTLMTGSALLLVAGLARDSRADLDKKTRQQAMQAVVWIADVQCARGGECDVVASGSGSVLTPDGVILTNNHVVQDVDSQGTPLYDMLKIGLVHDFDQPPETICIAYPQHALRDRDLDLALIKCEVDPDMQPLRPGQIVFPTVKMGDSTGVSPGDNVAVIGYPGVGGGTITYTTGKISGWTSDDDLQNQGVQEDSGSKRDWIKTDAKIAPGNSGGGAFDDYGTLIGVPSANWTQPQEGVQYTMGLIRPIERAKSLLLASADFDPSRIADSSDENWSTGGKGDGSTPVAQNGDPGATPPQGPPPTPPEVPPPLPKKGSKGGVHVVGQLVASDTGDPIDGGLVVVLKPGVKVGQITQDNIDKLYLTKADSDGTGNFALEDQIPAGTYAVVVLADGFEPLAVDDALEVNKKTPGLDDLGKIELDVSDQN